MHRLFLTVYNKTRFDYTDRISFTHFTVIIVERKPYMENFRNNKGTPTKVTSITDEIDLDYDFNVDYGDGDIPKTDKPRSSNSVKPDDLPRRDGPGGE